MVRPALVGLLVLCPAAAVAQGPGVVVLPFTIAGRGGADTLALRRSADRVVEHLNRQLRPDRRIHWLEYVPLRRPRDPATGRTMSARYGVVGLVRPLRRDSVWVRFELVSIEQVTRIMRDSLRAAMGAESTQVAPMALSLLAAVREAEQPAPAVLLQTDSVPPEAVTLYQRALVRANRNDTTAAVQLLRMALTIAPRYAEACDVLKRLRPGETCP